MDHKEALQWVVDNFKNDIEPFEAGTDLQKQTIDYRCWGCDGTFLSEWRTGWKRPTYKTFRHKKSCKYVKVMKLAERWGGANRQTVSITCRQK